MTEEQIQIMCSDWINIRYPELSKLYFFNSFQGMRLNFGQIKKAKKTFLPTEHTALIYITDILKKK